MSENFDIGLMRFVQNLTVFIDLLEIKLFFGFAFAFGQLPLLCNLFVVIRMGLVVSIGFDVRRRL